VRANLDGRVVADSEDVVEVGGYRYFPTSAVRTDWLERSPKTDEDRECPHGVQFYDVVLDGVRHERVAWSYEEPHGDMRRTAQRIGFWQEVEVG
jgi:uncharacterized protein (DUF427 family)